MQQMYCGGTPRSWHGAPKHEYPDTPGAPLVYTRQSENLGYILAFGSAKTVLPFQAVCFAKAFHHPTLGVQHCRCARAVCIAYSAVWFRSLSWVVTRHLCAAAFTMDATRV